MNSKKLDRNAERKRDASLSVNGHKKVTVEEIEFVQNLIERCLVLYMTKDEATSMLVDRTQIDQDFIHLVWQNLEEENPEFFAAYELRVELKKQIISYNQLLEKQYYLMKSDRDAMKQSLDYGHNNMPVNPSIGIPAEQPYLSRRDGVAYTHPLYDGSLNHIINESPIMSNFNEPNKFENVDIASDVQGKVATDVDPQPSSKLEDFMQKDSFLPNLCCTEEFLITMDGIPHFNTPNDWINFEDHTSFEPLCFPFSDIFDDIDVKIEPSDEFDIAHIDLIADFPSTEMQIQTDKENSLTGC